MTIDAVCNQALDTIGYKRHVGSIWDGSPAARVLLDAYQTTRDALFTALRPDWSVWDDPLVPSKSAPPYYDEQTVWTQAYPDLPWRYEYPLPALCLVPLAIKPRTSSVPVWRPRAMPFRVKAASGAYTMLGNDPSPILTCVHSVHETAVWGDDFTAAVVDALSKRIARALVGGAAPGQEQDDAGGRHARG
jgi:hypothetical protein